VKQRTWSDPAAVREVATRALTARGVPGAEQVVDVLLEASLLGVHTHGLRLLRSYLDELDRGVAVPDATPYLVRDTGPVALVDAGNALGVVAGLHAVAMVVERARRHGVGVIGVRRSNHLGAVGCYTRRIAAQGMLGFGTTSAASRVAPFGGAAPVFGTNPISVAYGDEFCLDMATSQVCYNEIKERARTGGELEPGWAVDRTGASVLDPAAAAALAPLGGYKGQGLAMMVTLLTSVLVGGPLDFELDHIGESPDGVGRGVTHLFLALDPDALGGRQAADATLDRLLGRVRDTRPTDLEQPVLVPGDPQRSHAARQRANGLEVDRATADLLDRLAVAG
jgi:LDH2 family malate/lactate/ureidoglycolate dehydrogenase